MKSHNIYVPWSQLFVLCVCLMVFSAAASGAGLVKKDTWQETMLASRKQFSTQTDQAPVMLSPWYITQPVATATVATPGFPEKAVDLKAKDKQGKKVWQRTNKYPDGAVHSLSAPGAHATYLYRDIKTDKPQTVKVSLGSDDGLQLFLNGQAVITRSVSRGVAPNQDTAILNLKAGKNALLFKVWNGGGGHGFYFSMLDDPAQVLWGAIAKHWSGPMNAMQADAGGAHLAWFTKADDTRVEQRMIQKVLRDIGRAGRKLSRRFKALKTKSKGPTDPAWLALYAEAVAVRTRQQDTIRQMDHLNLVALKLAIKDLSETYPDKYTKGVEYLKRIEAFEVKAAGQDGDDDSSPPDAAGMVALQREALLANPLLDFDKLLVVKRKPNNRLGLPQNWQGNCALPRSGYDNEIALLSPISPEGELSTFYRPDSSSFVGDVDLDFDADKMLFSMVDDHNRWQIFEIGADGKGLRQITSCPTNDVDNYDACYLPNGKIIYGSTACFHGVPCVGGGSTVANLFTINPDSSGVRQLCFDQDHDWTPAVLNNGQVLYTRWEYSDTSHYFTRLLMSMNPDGTSQMEYYGSNSYWPNSIFYARPIPNHPTAVVAIVSGHHGVARMGELVIFDPAKGRHEASGVVQRIPGYGKKVEPIIRDALVNSSWPKFLHPYPLSDKYFLVASQPTSRSLWGIYLVDIFDNMTLLKEVPGYALLEPVPFRKTPKPPVIPEKVDLTRNDATIYLSDIYEGKGLEGVPRGTVKQLRLYEFHYAYPKMGGHKHIAVEGTWDVHRILGTVPVEPDGSAQFKVPANMPIAVQPLDDAGMALQVMRSWFTAMPGETLSCVGCHERQSFTTPVRNSVAGKRAPDKIKPWYGPTRGFSFKREVQPVLNKYCVGCHDGKPRDDGRTLLDFTEKDRNGWSNFTPSYLALHPFVRRPGPESDYHLQKPLEFHASTSELVQMLKKGHHNVKLDREAWERLITWIDLNVPDHGTWQEHRRIAGNFHQRRMEERSKFACRPEDPEIIPELPLLAKPVAFIKPQPVKEIKPDNLSCPKWPFDGDVAAKRQKDAAAEVCKTVTLADGVTMDFVRVPAGEFIMGSFEGVLDEYPRSRVKVDKPFWLGVTEVTCAQYALFNAAHENGYFDQHHKDHTTPGYPAHGDDFPVIRISWHEAMAFTQWMSQKTGLTVTLPTEAQWEWACRAGTDAPFHYGNLDTDFTGFDNLADKSLVRMAVSGVNPRPIKNPSPYQDFLPKDARFDDGHMLLAPVGQFKANPWGLQDMHGNVAEWTRTSYRPYPYVDNDGRNALNAREDKVVRGGTFMDRPKRARSSFRLSYRAYQPVYNVGFRVMLSD